MIRSVRFRATGRVQGVSFRAFTARAAQRLRLDGWVRNEPDGSVIGEARGPEDAVDHLLNALREGPTAARVDDLEVEPLDPADADGGGFTIRR